MFYVSEVDPNMNKDSNKNLNQMDDWVKWSLGDWRTRTHCTGVWEIKLDIGIQVICCNTFQKKQGGDV